MNKIALRFIAIILLTIMHSFIVKAESFSDILEEAKEVLETITCETKGFNEYMFGEYTHSCIQTGAMNDAIATAITGGYFPLVIMKTKISDTDLFNQPCSVQNRANPMNPEIEFAFCSNMKLVEARGKALANLGQAVMTNVLNEVLNSGYTESSIKEAILDAIKLDPKDYHEFQTRPIGYSGWFYDVSIPPVIPWIIVQRADQICVATGVDGINLPIGCKFIKEPYPISTYDNEDNMPALMRCGDQGSCSQLAKGYSQTLIPMSGPIISCVREMITRLVSDPNKCYQNNATAIKATSNNAFYEFQQTMRRYVTALLTISIIIFGFRIALSGSPPKKADLVSYLVKFILVSYFSVGINTSTSGDQTFDGMTQWVFPILFQGANEIASWVMNASDSNFCTFNMADYEQGWEFLSLWDSLDCRVTSYMGIDSLQTANVAVNQGLSGDNAAFPIPPYILLLIPGIITMNFTLIAVAIAFPLLILSVAAYMVNAFVLSMIGVMILGILGPIFIPMALFSYTKGFFESWAKLMIAFILQPTVITAFMVIMFNVFDTGFFGGCKYKPYPVSVSKSSLSPAIGVDGITPNASDYLNSSTPKKIFMLDTNKDSYETEEYKKCTKSLGWMLMSASSFAMETASPGVALVKEGGSAMFNGSLTSFSDYQEKYPFLNVIKWQRVLFFSIPIIDIDYLAELILTILTSCILLYLMYSFCAQLSKFAADVTGGISTEGMGLSPTSIYEKSMSALNMAKNAKGGGESGASDKIATGSGGDGASRKGGASDKVSSGSGGASDKISSGDGKKDGGSK